MHDDISAEPVIDYEPCFNISFSRPAKTVFAKIAKALGLSEKYSPVYHKSLPLTGEAAQQKKTLIKALDAGKIKYRKEKGIEIEEATAKFKQAMKPEKLENGLPKSKKMSSSPRFSPGGFGPL